MMPFIITCASEVVAIASSAFDELLGCMSKKSLQELDSNTQHNIEMEIYSFLIMFVSL